MRPRERTQAVDGARAQLLARSLVDSSLSQNFRNPMNESEQVGASTPRTALVMRKGPLGRRQVRG